MIDIDGENPSVEHGVEHDEKHAEHGGDGRAGPCRRNVPLVVDIDYGHDVDDKQESKHGVLQVWVSIVGHEVPDLIIIGVV